MFTHGTDQPIGDKHKCSIGERHTFGSSQTSIEDAPEAELIEEGPKSQDRPPRRGIEDPRIGRWGILRIAFTAQETLELGKNRGEQVFAAQVSDCALPDLAVFAIGFDGSYVLVDRTVRGAEFDRAEVDVAKYHDVTKRNQGIICEIYRSK